MINIFCSTLATEVTGPDTLWFFSYEDTLKTMPTNHHYPQNVRELQDHFLAEVQTVDGNMLKRVWQELDYHIDICRVTKGAYMEYLWADFYW